VIKSEKKFNANEMHSCGEKYEITSTREKKYKENIEAREV